MGDSLHSRQSHLDTVCGVLIVYMIFMHCEQWADATDTIVAKITGRLFFFFMPWFFFKAGMFFNQDADLAKVVKSSIKRLLVPFILYSMVGHCFFCVMRYFENEEYSIVPLKSLLYYGACSGNAPLWFLLTLFSVRILVKFVSKHADIRLVLLIGGGGALMLNMTCYEGPFWVANVLSGMFFYVVGYLFRNLQYRDFFVVLSGGGYLIALFFPSMVDMNRNILYSGCYFFWMVTSIAGCIIVNNFSYRFLNGLKMVQIIGKNSMFYYCTHWIVLIIATMVLKLMGANWADEKILFVYCVSIAFFYFFPTFWYMRKGKN